MGGSSLATPYQKRSWGEGTPDGVLELQDEQATEWSPWPGANPHTWNSEQRKIVPDLMDEAADAFAEMLGARDEANPPTDEAPAEDTTDEVDDPEQAEVDDPDLIDLDADELDELEPDEADEDVEDDDTEGEDGDDEETSDEDAETYVVKVDGEEIEVTLDEALQGYQRDADYRRKTQALAEQRRQFEQEQQELTEFQEQAQNYFEERSQDPAGWMVEIATQSGNPTALFAEALVDAAAAGQLDKQFVEAFGLDEGALAERAEQAAQQRRARQLEQREQALQEQEQTREQQQQRQQLVQQYEQQWQDIADESDLTFDSPEEELNAKVELLKFCRETETADLRVGWRAMQAEKAEKERQRQEKLKQRASKRRKARKKSASVSKAGSSAKAPTPQPNSLDEAASQALAEVRARRAAR